MGLIMGVTQAPDGMGIENLYSSLPPVLKPFFGWTAASRTQSCGNGGTRMRSNATWTMLAYTV